MVNLLQIEWLKIRKYKPFWIIFAFCLILFPLATLGCGYMFREAIKELFKGTPIPPSQIPNPFDFKYVFYTSAWINNGLNIAWGMLLILMVTNEFQSKTIRQNVIDGQNRSDIITSKIFLVLFFSLLSAILVVLGGLISGIIFSSSGFSFDTSVFKVFGISFAAAIMQMLFALVFAFWIKRPAVAVIIYLGYTIFVENVFVHLILRAVAKFEYGRLFFTQAADELTSNPLVVMNPDKPDTIDATAPWIACVVYGAGILFFLYRYINRIILK